MGRTYGYARVSSTEQNLGRQIEALLEYGVVSACFVSAGGSDLIKPKYLSLKPDESLNFQNCERRLIVIDTTGMRGRNKEQKLFQTILDDYIRYAEQKIVPVAYPDIGWLPLVISTDERDERFYNIDIQSADLSMVTEVTAVLRKLYRNALVGISESGFARLRETVIAWADEKVTERNATGAYSSRYKSMPDFLYACCRYCAAGDIVSCNRHCDRMCLEVCNASNNAELHGYKVAAIF